MRQSTPLKFQKHNSDHTNIIVHRPRITSAPKLPAVVLAATLAVATLPSAAQTPPGDIDLSKERQERLLQDQQRRLQELRQLPGAASESAGTVFTAPGQCFEIRAIELKGATLPDADARRDLLSAFEGRCLGTATLDELLRRITGWYLDRGYVTSRAYLPEQDLADGTLEIVVVEGRLEEVVPGPDSRLTPLELDIAFPGRAGEHLNLRELEQLVDQLNRLPSNRAAVELTPGDTVGGSRAVIANTPDKPWRLSFSRHNDGQASTGEQQWAAGLELDSPLGLADQLTVRGGASARESRLRKSENAHLQYSLPWGWWTFSYRYSQNDYRTTNDASGFAFELTGDSRSHEIRAERLLMRDAVSKTAVNFMLGQLETRNYIERSLIGVSSQRLAEAGLGFNHGRRIGGAFINLDLGWQQGITAFGGRSDHQPEPGSPRAQYNKYSFTASLLRPFELAGQAFSVDSLLYIQKSEDVLYGPRRISVGGSGSVRGFKDQALSGDSGGYWRNQLRWRAPIAANTFGTAAADWLPWVAEEAGVTLAWDTGLIARDRNNQATGQHGRLSGAAIELVVRGRHLQAGLSFARSLARPDALPDAEHPVLFRLEFFL